MIHKHVPEVVMNINVRSDVQGLLWEAIWFKEYREITFKHFVVLSLDSEVNLRSAGQTESMLD